VSSAIVDTAVRHAGGKPVAVVTARIGHLRQVVPDSLRFYWGVVTRETLCERARLDLELIPAWLECRACELTWKADAAAFRCPSCTSGDITVLSGEELEVESIELEVDTCTA